jgi:uncharacterized protein YndB with AHSA1/START domain
VTERSAIHSSFVVERTYDASPSRVFAAFADPEAKRRWCADADGWRTDTFQLDFRVGGQETYRGGPQDGPAISLDGRYYDIVTNERIVYTYDMHLDGVRISVSLTTIEFAAESAGTRLVFTEHDTFLDGHESVGSREEGTRGLLEALDAELRRQPVSS